MRPSEPGLRITGLHELDESHSRVDEGVTVDGSGVKKRDGSGVKKRVWRPIFEPRVFWE